jgi:hypothetical protein
MKTFSAGQLIFNAILGYAGATFFSYKYGQCTKAQNDLKKVDDRKVYLLETHQNLAEKYNSMM